MGFMVTPCINNIQHPNFQLMHTTLKNVVCVLSTHSSRVIICSHNTDNVFYKFYTSTLNQACDFS